MHYYVLLNRALSIFTLKAPITTAADDIHKYFFIVFFSEKKRLYVRQRIHLKHQALFSSQDKSKKLKCHLLQFWFGALRVRVITGNVLYNIWWPNTFIIYSVA